jgi:membrane fusion protein (multidrug efflux system)
MGWRIVVNTYFRLTFEFYRSLKLMRSARYFIILILGLGPLSSCKDVTKGVETPPEFQVIQVIKRDIPIYRAFVGQVYGFQDIPIRARVEGFVEGVHFDEGLAVKKGQLLYTIDPQPYEAQVASMQGGVAEAQTYLVNAENELARYKPLAEINAVSKSDLDAAQASRDAAVASLDAAKANLRMSQINLSYTRILSPIDGLIGKTEARTGEFVGREPNPVILNVVSQIDQIRVQFFLTESEYLTVIRRSIAEHGRNRKIDNIELMLADGTAYDQKGSVEFLGRNIDTSTGSILVQAVFPNPDHLLRPGMFAKVNVQYEFLTGALLVPQRCVIELQGQYSVFVVESDNMVKSRQVNVSDKIGDLWLVTEGLKPEDKIVVDGLQQVTSGMKVLPIMTEFKSQTPDIK